MFDALVRIITRPSLRLPIGFAIVLLSPLTVMADPETLLCESARTQIEQIRSTLLPLKKQQKRIQQHVRAIYQKLFTCQTSNTLSAEQKENCMTLQEEGPKHFQSMINVITLTYQTSQQLADQTRQIQNVCPAISDDTFPKIAKLGRS